MKQYLKNKFLSFIFFTIIMLFLSLIYAIFLSLSSSSFTYNSNLINNHYITYFIGLFSFFILGIISGIKEKKKGIVAGISSSLILLFIVIIIKIINDTFNLSLPIIIKYLSYIFISIFGGILGVNKNGK